MVSHGFSPLTVTPTKETLLGDELARVVRIHLANGREGSGGVGTGVERRDWKVQVRRRDLRTGCEAIQFKHVVEVQRFL